MKNKVVSLFSGGGGLDLGFKNAGYDIIWAVDNDQNAVDTYRYNIGKHIIYKDINEISWQEIPDCDVIIGGPPCQSFSLAGKRNTEDERGRLVWKYIEIIRGKKPELFLFENVTGLLSARGQNGEKIIDRLFTAFQEIGYVITWKVMNAADYGVPQKRRRLIIVGCKKGRDFQFPNPTHSRDGVKGEKYVSVAEAIADLPEAIREERAQKYAMKAQTPYQKKMRGKNHLVTEQVLPKMSDLDQYIISHVKPGGNYRDIPTDVNSQRIRRLQREGGHTTCYGRMKAEEPSYTINTYFNRPNVGCNIHYSANRLITVREALRLQSFPDHFKLISKTKQGKHLIVGNAVPPLLAERLAEELKQYLVEKE